MKLMWRYRKRQSILSRPDLRFIRTVQAPEHVVEDKHTKQWRFSSQAFRASTGDHGLSGDLEELLVNDGLAADSLYPAVDRAVGAAAFRVQDALNLGLSVHHEPAPKNWYHGSVRGKLDKGIQQRLRDSAQALVPIDEDAARRYRDDKMKRAAARAARNGTTL